MTGPTDETAKDELYERLGSFEARTRDVRASRGLLLRLEALAEGRSERDVGLSFAIVRLALPSLVAASLAAGALFVLDRTSDASLADELALAAAMEIEP